MHKLFLALCFIPSLAFGFGVPKPLPVLDQLTTLPSVAYSVRVVENAAYGQPLMVIRRSSDNTSRNIYYLPNGALDWQDAQAFAGSGNAFIVTWKNERTFSAAGDATQSTAASQPQIVASGVVETQNGVQSVYFNGAQNLSSAAYTAYSAGFYQNVVGGIYANTAYNTFSGRTAGIFHAPVDTLFNTASMTEYFAIGANGTTIYFPTIQYTIANGFSIWGAGASLSQAIFSRNGVVQSFAAPSTYQDVSTATVLGARNDLVSTLNGFISEFSIFPVVLSTSDLATLEVNQAAFFGISGVTQ